MRWYPPQHVAHLFGRNTAWRRAIERRWAIAGDRAAAQRLRAKMRRYRSRDPGHVYRIANWGIYRRARDGDEWERVEWDERANVVDFRRQHHARSRLMHNWLPSHFRRRPRR